MTDGQTHHYQGGGSKTFITMRSYMYVATLARHVSSQPHIHPGRFDSLIDRQSFISNLLVLSYDLPQAFGIRLVTIHDMTRAPRARTLNALSPPFSVQTTGRLDESDARSRSLYDGKGHLIQALWGIQ